ncbi:MAG: hypothetical protein HC828_03005 [Blastochloris sp.]|nr:hypothetical protein [Blastochloris sp.]
MQPYDNDHLIDELAACEARMRMAERELEVLAWLPTAAWFTALERLNRERERMDWVYRLRFGRPERAEHR